MSDNLKCTWCNKNDATRQDYRRGSKYFACELCFSLNDKTVRKIQEEKLDPEIYYEPIKPKLT